MDLAKLKMYKDNFFKSDKNIKVIVVIGLIAVIIILFSELLGGNDNKITDNKKSAYSEDSNEYVEYMEDKIHKIVSSIENVGNVEIMVTLKSSKENVYVQEERTNNDSIETSSDSSGSKLQNKDTYEEKVVIVDKDGKRDALIKTTLEPTIKGVVVVCNNGDNSIIQQNISKAVTTALDISSARVSIIAGK